MPRTDTDFDCLIVGGGPAGLAAATYLGRFRRRTLLIDAGASRAALIPKSRNFPGQVDGIRGVEILTRMKAQAERYGARFEHGDVSSLASGEDGRFVATALGQRLTASRVVLATGVVDNMPDIDGLHDHVRHGRIRVCPVCDAFEIIDKPVAIYGTAEHVFPKALFLRTYTPDLTLLCTDTIACPSELEGPLRQAGIVLPSDCVVELKGAGLNNNGDGIAARFASGREKRFSAIYAAMGSRPRSQLFNQLGGGATPEGCIDTDDHQRTSIPGVWAIGDVVDALDQIAVAVGHAAIAATDLHNSLRESTA
jgi:thioredoxin reductase (NADPH)